MSNYNQPRIPPGTGKGGEWTHKQQPEATDVSLTPQGADVLSAKAGDANANPLVLDALARNEPRTDVRATIAANEATRPETLEALAEDRDPRVRTAVAENVNTPEHVLDALRYDHHPGVLLGLIDNPNTPSDVINNLGYSESEYIARRSRERFRREFSYPFDTYEDGIEAFDSLLDEEGLIEIDGLSFDRSRIVKELDERAYNERLGQYLNDSVEDPAMLEGYLDQP